MSMSRMSMGRKSFAKRLLPSNQLAAKVLPQIVGRR